MEEKKQFYKKGWFTGLLLLLFFPVGVVLLWKYHNRRKVLNVVLSLMFGFFFLGVVGAMLVDDEPSQSVSQNRPPQQSQVTANNDSENNTAAKQDDTADIVSIMESPTLEPESKTEPVQTQVSKTETVQPQTDISELKKVFNAYFNEKKKSDKDKLLKSTPQDLYDVAMLAIITNQNRPEITSESQFDLATINYIKRVCDTYLEIFATGTVSDKVKELKGYTEQMIACDDETAALVKKYKSDNGNFLTDGNNPIYTLDFYIQNAIGVQSNSSIGNFLLGLGIYDNQIPQSYGGTIGYTDAFGSYMPSEDKCVVQPVSEYTFSQAGVYTLNVIYDRDIEVVTVQGFKSFVPLYIELSDEFIEQFSHDRDRLHDIEEERYQIEQSLKELLAV